MKTSIKTVLATAAAITALTTAGWAMAQQGPGKGGHPEDCGPGHSERGGKMSERMGKRMEERQTQLKTALKLNANQEAAWSQYQQAMKPPAAPAAMADRAEWSKLTTPQRLEKMQAMHAERQKQMAQHVQATQQFYAALTPEQQKVFDTQQNHGKRGHGDQGGKREHRHG
jgi:Spy/CpxP family protein refolding chaperone